MVSVIIPVYKVEKYLKRCIDSVLAQTYKNLDIILVDDGSPDTCGAICDKYSQMDNRIRVIHKLNGGLSSARNAGLKLALGKYISFVDSDDWLDKEYIERLRSVMINNDADMSACMFCRAKDENTKRKFFDDDIELISDKKFHCALSDNSYAGYACSKLFKRDIIVKNNLQFDEKIFNGEDFPFTLEYLQYTNKVAFVKRDLYYYFFNENGIMNSIRLNDRFLSILYAREKSLKFLQENAPDCYDICKASYLSILSKIKFMAMLNLEKNKDIYIDVSNKLKTARKGLFFLKYVSFRVKLKLFVMIYFPRICSRVYEGKVRLVE